MATRTFPVNMVAVKDLPEEAERGAADGPWPGVLAKLVTDQDPDTWIEVRRYVSPTGAKGAYKALLKRASEGTLEGVGETDVEGTLSYTTDDGTLHFITVAARRVPKAEDNSQSVLFMAWNPSTEETEEG